jgi:hypothetical protein
MAETWIRVRANLSKDNVAAKLAPLCRNDRQKAAGVLIDYWSGVAEHCVNGYVRDTADDVLEDFANWKGRKGAFAKWAREQHTDDDGRVKGWDDYMGPLETRKLFDRERRRLERAEKSSGHPLDSPQDVHKTVHNLSDDTKTKTVRNGTENQHPPSARAALLRVLGTPSRRHGMDACLRIWAQGIDLPPGVGIPTGAHIEQACREVLASVDVADLKPRVVRGFLVRTMRGDREPAHAGKRGLSQPADDFMAGGSDAL